MNTFIRHSWIFIVFLLGFVLLGGMAVPKHAAVLSPSHIRLYGIAAQPQVGDTNHPSDREYLVAAVHEHDLYDITEQMDLKDEWSKLLDWAILSVCLFLFCYPAFLQLPNNRTPYMDRLVLPPKYILFQSLKIPFQG
ncbi:hypothetical protein ACR78Z_02795 [Sphingobacterium thalpophilum]|uniref:Uncharacterized protein n=1 Tax=Sphingobacterium thalpophilum TaxID=259 RepID=A0A4U9W769_9SPHI|nr:hypothetical protein [Sphingobacterium thalpophilum]VTR54697.1 Uncharacterised protein [Sphingobacterium thalpophilum]